MVCPRQSKMELTWWKHLVKWWLDLGKTWGWLSGELTWGKSLFKWWSDLVKMSVQAVKKLVKLWSDLVKTLGQVTNWPGENIGVCGELTWWNCLVKWWIDLVKISGGVVSTVWHVGVQAVNPKPGWWQDITNRDCKASCSKLTSEVGKSFFKSMSLMRTSGLAELQICCIHQRWENKH